MPDYTEIIQLLDRKIVVALRDIDRRTASKIQEVWNTINPSPACPYVGDVMQEINRICHNELRDRGNVVKEIIFSTLDSIDQRVSSDFANEIVELVSEKFPGNTCLTKAYYTKTVNSQRLASANKFSENAFNSRITAIEAWIRTLSRETIDNIKIGLDELLITNLGENLTATQKLKEFLLKSVGKPKLSGYVM